MSYDEHDQFIYELKPYTVTCKCGKTETASQASLEVDGWVLTECGESCRACTKKIVTYALRNSGSVVARIEREKHIPFVPFQGYPMSEEAK